ncbi:hypothetical protein, partial [Photobacterium minamisatsumaniensis]|uniref:hypothetical protein n=1 Tax=Photobacterium minamisatsumaniensis TaxID=2910233 RepID=UPI003D0A63C9
ILILVFNTIIILSSFYRTYTCHSYQKVLFKSYEGYLSCQNGIIDTVLRVGDEIVYNSSSLAFKYGDSLILIKYNTNYTSGATEQLVLYSKDRIVKIKRNSADMLSTDSPIDLFKWIKVKEKTGNTIF